MGGAIVDTARIKRPGAIKRSAILTEAAGRAIGRAITAGRWMPPPMRRHRRGRRAASLTENWLEQHRYLKMDDA